MSVMPRSTAKHPFALSEIAQSFAGYRSAVNRDNIFGKQTGYNGEPWGGSFVEVCLRKLETSTGTSHIRPSFIRPVVALNFFSSTFPKRNLLTKVFFHAGSSGVARLLTLESLLVFYINSNGELQVGVSVKSDRFKEDGVLQAVCGEVSSGLARGPQESDGVYVRSLHVSEVVGFVRMSKILNNTYPGQLLTFRHEPLRAGDVNPAHSKHERTYVILLQEALSRATGEREFVRGVFDGKTRRALTAYAVQQGVYRESDIAKDDVLQGLLNKLGRDTGLWSSLT